MAKKPKTSKGDLMGRLLTATSTDNNSVLSESEFFTDRDIIRSRVPALNIALFGELDGGVTSGLTVIAGPSKHFKSNIGLIGVNAYLRKYEDAVCLFFDNEFGSPPDYFAAQGIDLNRVIHCPFNNIEDLKFEIVKKLDAIERGDRVIIFIDSLGNAASKKEIEDAREEKSTADMTRAKQMKSVTRMITPYLTTKDIPCIAIAHTYDTQEMYSKKIVSGGCVVADTMIKMSDGAMKSVQDIEVGEYVNTLVGTSVVTHTWNPETLEVGEPECYRVTFDDGYSVECSDVHKFLVMDNDLPKWVEAKDLILGMDVVTK